MVIFIIYFFISLIYLFLIEYISVYSSVKYYLLIIKINQNSDSGEKLHQIFMLP